MSKWEAPVGLLKVAASFNEDGDFFLFSNRDGSLGAGSLRILHPTASVEQIAESICQMHEERCGARPDLPIADLAISNTPLTMFGGRNIRLRDVARLDTTSALTMTAEAAERPEATLGLCFAFDYNELVRAATDEHVSWHEWLLKRTLAGLSEGTLTRSGPCELYARQSFGSILPCLEAASAIHARATTL